MPPRIFIILRSCAHKTRITLPDRWQRRRNGFTRHVELPAPNAFCAATQQHAWWIADENFYRLRSCALQTRITLPDRWQRKRNGLMRDTWSLQHLMRFRRRSATSVVDASENFF